MSEALDSADLMALRLASIMTERHPENRNQRTESQIIDEQKILAWGLREYAKQISLVPESRRG